MKRAVFISCFNSYDNRVKPYIDVFLNNGYKIRYLYADFDHITKEYHEKIYKNGVCIHVKRYKRNISLSRLLSHYLFSKKTIKYIKDYKPDFIYCMVPPNSLVKKIGLYKKTHADVKVVFDVYDMWPESFPCSGKINFILKIPFGYWRNLRKNYIGYADMLFGVSEEGKKFLSKETNEKPIEVIRPIVPVGEMPKYNPATDELSFCYLGMVNHIIDMELGVFLLGELAKVKKTVLHIIGEGQYLQRFTETLSDVGVEVVCHGCVFDQSEKNKIFSLCNMGLNIPRKEIDSTMSLKAVEYMRVGLPFINNANGEMHRIVEEDEIGLNVNTDIKILIKEILDIKKSDYMKMHENCIESYKSRFINQDYESVLQSFI